MKKSRRRFVAMQIKRIVRGYTKCSSILNPYLSIEMEYLSSTEPEVNKILNVIETEGDYPGLDAVNNDSEASSNSGEEVEEEEDGDDEDLNESEHAVCAIAVISSGDEDEIQTNNIHGLDLEEASNENEIPGWLRDSLRAGNIHSCVMDILTLRTYFCVPQIEEYAYPHSHKISLPILRVLAGLLLETNDGLLRYWTRNDNNKLDWFTIEPITETNSVKKFPSLRSLPETPLSVRKQIFLETLGLEKELTSVPCEWELFIATTAFWLKNMKEPHISICHLHSLVMCIVCINLIDSRLGRHRVKRTFTKKYGTYLNKVLLTKKQQKQVIKHVPASAPNAEPDNKQSSIKDCLECVMKEDCVVIFNSILPYHHVSEQLKMKPKLFERTIVHAFSQFQSCFHLALVLNSVLNFPVEQCFVSKFLSGTFIYNMYTNLTKRNNVDAYIETFFSSVPRILQLYKKIIDFILLLVPDNMFTETVIKTRKKKKRAKSPLILSSQMVKHGNSSEEELFVDENNMYSVLAVSTTG